jgi:hypothetical protein
MELMDRISTKEGVRELFIVASRVDEQLYGSEKENANGILPQAIENIRDALSEHAIQTLTGLKKNHPEVADQFDQLIEGGKDRVIVTSAICNAMSLHFNERDLWDEDMKYVWGLLTDEYPDYFPDSDSGKENLDLLSNTRPVKEKIEACREQKDRIMANKRDDYLKQQTANIKDYHEKLIEALKKDIEELRTSDIETLEKQSNELKKIQSNGGDAINNTIIKDLDNFKRRVRNELDKPVQELNNEIQQMKKEQEETHTEQRKREKGGFGGGFLRVVGGFGRLFTRKENNLGYETYNENVTTLRAGAVKVNIQEVVRKYDAQINRVLDTELGKLTGNKGEEPEKKPKNIFFQKIGDSFEKVAGTDLFNELTPSLEDAVEKMIHLLEDTVAYNYRSPDFSCTTSSIISGDDAIAAFSMDVVAYMETLRDGYDNNMKGFLQRIESSALNNSPADLLFNEMQKKIDKLTEQLQNKQVNIERLEKVLAEVKRLA